MKKIFIYYSNTGNGDFLSSDFLEKGYEIRKVVPKKELPKKFFFKVFIGGFLAGLNIKARLKNYNNSVKDFDEIVVGSPIWCGKLSCPINTVIRKTDFAGKKLSFVLYAGGGVAQKAEETLRKKFPSCRIVVLKEPKKYKEELEKIKF